MNTRMSRHGEGKIQVGMIGMGGIARNRHVAALRAHAGQVAIRAICDADPDAVERGRADVPEADAYTDSRALLADPAIDAVLLALPNHLHLEGCRHAAAAGKHILLEKPIARTPAEADQVIAAARQAGVMLMIAHSDRYSPVFRETRRLLDEGTLGEVIALHVDHYSNYVNPPGGWRRSRELIGGGCVMDTGIHQLDLLSWYLGTPAEVFAYAATDPARLESEVVCTAVFKFAGGAIAEFFCNWGAFRSPPARIRNNEGLSLFGTRGTLYVMDYETLVLASPTDDPTAPRTQELKVQNTGEWVAMWGALHRLPAYRRHPAEQRPGGEEGGGAGGGDLSQPGHRRTGTLAARGVIGAVNPPRVLRLPEAAPPGTAARGDVIGAAWRGSQRTRGGCISRRSVRWLPTRATGRWDPRAAASGRWLRCGATFGSSGTGRRWSRHCCAN